MRSRPSYSANFRNEQHIALHDGRFSEARQFALEWFNTADELGEFDVSAHSLFDVECAFALQGGFAEARSAAARATEYALERHQPSWALRGRLCLAGIALEQNQLAEAAELLHGMPADFGMGPPQVLTAMVAERSGWFEEAARLTADVERTYPLSEAGFLWPGLYYGHRARLHFVAGADEDALLWFGRWRVAEGAVPETMHWVTVISYALLPLLAFGDRGLQERVYRRLSDYPALSSFMGVPMGSYRGALALRLGHRTDARKWFSEGVDWATSEGCPLERAQCLAGLEPISADPADGPVAADYRDRANAAFAEISAPQRLVDVWRSVVCL